MRFYEDLEKASEDGRLDKVIGEHEKYERNWTSSLGALRYSEADGVRIDYMGDGMIFLSCGIIVGHVHF